MPNTVNAPSGNLVLSADFGKVYGPKTITFDTVTVGAGVAATVIQTTRTIKDRFKLKSVDVHAATATAVSAVPPTANVFATLAPPPAPPTILAATPIAGNIENGAHLYVQTFTTARGETIQGPSMSVTVVDKTVNGKTTTLLAVGPTGTTARTLYRTKLGAPTVWYIVAVTANNTAGVVVTDNLADASLTNTQPPTGNTGSVSVLSAAVSVVAARNAYTGAIVPTATPQGWSGGPDPIFPAGTILDVGIVTGASTGAFVGYVSVDIETLPADA